MLVWNAMGKGMDAFLRAGKTGMSGKEPLQWWNPPPNRSSNLLLQHLCGSGSASCTQSVGRQGLERETLHQVSLTLPDRWTFIQCREGAAEQLCSERKIIIYYGAWATIDQYGKVNNSFWFRHIKMTVSFMFIGSFYK